MFAFTLRVKSRQNRRISWRASTGESAIEIRRERLLIVRELSLGLTWGCDIFATSPNTHTKDTDTSQTLSHPTWISSSLIHVGHSCGPTERSVACQQFRLGSIFADTANSHWILSWARDDHIRTRALHERGSRMSMLVDHWRAHSVLGCAPCVGSARGCLPL